MRSISSSHSSELSSPLEAASSCQVARLPHVLDLPRHGNVILIMNRNSNAKMISAISIYIVVFFVLATSSLCEATIDVHVLVTNATLPFTYCSRHDC